MLRNEYMAKGQRLTANGSPNEKFQNYKKYIPTKFLFNNIHNFVAFSISYQQITTLNPFGNGK